jgi:hypothetical protein
MARSLTNNEVAQFDAEVKQAYQGSSMIRPTIRVKTGVVGATHQFPKFGKGLATPRLPQTDVIPMNVQQTNVVATIEDFNAPEYTDIFDQQKVNYSERSELATTIAMAIGRRQDQLIIDAMVAASGFAGTIPSAVMTVATLREASKFLNDQAVPTADRHIIWSPTAQEQLLGTTEATSSDFNVVKALVNGEVNSFMGFQFRLIETREEGGLPLSGNNRTCFAYHGGQRGSTGLAVGIDFRTTVDWIAEKTSWLSNGLFSAGSVVIDALGIVQFIVDES